MHTHTNTSATHKFDHDILPLVDFCLFYIFAFICISFFSVRFFSSLHLDFWWWCCCCCCFVHFCAYFHVDDAINSCIIAFWVAILLCRDHATNIVQYTHIFTARTHIFTARLSPTEMVYVLKLPTEKMKFCIANHLNGNLFNYLANINRID